MKLKSESGNNRGGYRGGKGDSFLGRESGKENGAHGESFSQSVLNHLTSVYDPRTERGTKKLK